MNVYDFDKTIFYPDSSAAFILWLGRKYPRLIFKTLPGVISDGIKYYLGKADTTSFKEKLFAFLPYVSDIDVEVCEFWNKYGSHILSWYLSQSRNDDVVISAGPEFLHKPVAEKLGFTLIGTRMDKHSGKIDGYNCKGQEKVRRFRNAFPDARVEAFYSDNPADLPMAREAEHAFLLSKGKIKNWNL